MRIHGWVYSLHADAQNVQEYASQSKDCASLKHSAWPLARTFCAFAPEESTEISLYSWPELLHFTMTPGRKPLEQPSF